MSPSQQTPRLRVATLNIWNRSGPWPRRLEVIRRQLGELEPDLLGLQEVMRLESGAGVIDQGLEVAGGLGYEVAYAEAHDIGSGLTVGNALLSRHPILEHQAIALPGRGQSDFDRSLLAARVNVEGVTVPVFVTHLVWRRHEGPLRLAQVRAIAQAVRRIAPLGDENAYPSILMGDFNAEPLADEVRYLKGLASGLGDPVFWADAWDYRPDGSPGHTFDGTRNPYASHEREPPRRIDYIFVRGPDRRFRGEPIETRLCFDRSEQVEGELIWPSDHFGVITDLRL